MVSETDECAVSRVQTTRLSLFEQLLLQAQHNMSPDRNSVLHFEHPPRRGSDRNRVADGEEYRGGGTIAQRRCAAATVRLTRRDIVIYARSPA